MALLLSNILGYDETWLVATANQSANDGDKIACDVSGGGFTITLPSSPNTGDSIEVCQGDGQFSVNNVVIARNGNNIMGLAEDMNLNIDNISVELIFNGSEWRIA